MPSSAQQRARVELLDVRGKEPDGAEEPGMRRDQDAPDVERFGKPRGVHRTAAAERDQREVARIAAALDRNRAYRALHGRVRDPVDAFRGVEERKPERLGDVFPECSLGARRVEPQLAADEIAGVQIAEDEVGVRDRRTLAAPTVAGGAGHGPRAFRADAEHAAGIDPGDGAAAGADLRHVDRGDADQVAPALDEPAALVEAPAHLVLRRQGNRAAFDDRRFRGGTAHVERDQVVEPGDARLPPRAAITPAAGPLSMIRTGLAAAARSEKMPPPDCITRTGADTPAASKLVRRLCR